MTIKNLLNIAWKSMFALTLFLILCYGIGLLVENKIDISLWRQGTKDTMGIILGIATIISGVVITGYETEK